MEYVERQSFGLIFTILTEEGGKAVKVKVFVVLIVRN